MNRNNFLSSSSSIVIIGIVFLASLLWLYYYNSRGTKPEDVEGGSWAHVAIKDFNYETIKVGQPISSFKVEVASHGTKFCNKPNVFIGKVSASSPTNITPKGVSYDFKIPIEGHLIANCTLEGGN